MGKRSSRMYDKSKQPTMERDDDGKMAVSKGQKKADTVASGTEGVIREDEEGGVPASARHSIERMEMSTRHMNEHHTHDYGDHGDKKEMHERHMKEMRDMFKRHDKESVKSSGEGKTGDDKIEKIEADSKEKD